MSDDKPTGDVREDLICIPCQRAARNRIAGKRQGLSAVFAYCRTTGRAMFLRGWDGEIVERSVSKPGDRDALERKCVENWEKWCAVAELAQAQIELSEHDGPVH